MNPVNLTFHPPKPKLEKLYGGLFPKYRLLEEYVYYFRHKGKVAAFIVPKGYEYDGASFGSFLFWRKSMHESAHTLAHDWIYDTKGMVRARYLDIIDRPNGWPFRLEKEDADRIWLEGARRDENIQNWRTHVASGAFKTIGHLYWEIG